MAERTSGAGQGRLKGNMPKSSTASGAVGKGLADVMKKTKKGRLKLKVCA